MTKEVRYRMRKPWARFVGYARRRCRDVRGRWFRYYGARGIKAPLTVAEAEELWRRDGADRLKRPSLDRIDPSGHYEIGNCRFVEFVENVRLAWDKAKGGETWGMVQ